MPTTAHVLQQAQHGDEDAFAHLVTPYRRELHVHCYRMLGSFDDAEDALQDTLLAAWRGIGGFRAEASVRTWLYRLATNTCLNRRRTTSRRPQAAAPPPGTAPPPNGTDPVTWLQPYPDALLDALPEPSPGPESRIEIRESVSLAFIATVQALSPRGRAVLVLRPQRRPGPAQLGGNGVRRRSQHPGDLATAEPHDVAQHQDRAAARAQGLHRRDEGQ